MMKHRFTALLISALILFSLRSSAQTSGTMQAASYVPSFSLSKIHAKPGPSVTMGRHLGKSTSCTPDTIEYTFQKATNFKFITIDSLTSARKAFQWYPAPSSLTVNGFDFFSAVSSTSTTGVSTTVNCKVYL